MRLRRIVDDLTGRAHHRVLDVLRAQIDVAMDGISVAIAMTGGALTTSAARARINEVEHDGDTRRGELVAELSAALTTPIDREDLYRLSRSIDDVLDNLRDFVREADLYAVDPDLAAQPLLEAVAAGLRTLRQAVDLMLDRPGDVAAASLLAHKQAGRVRVLYQSAMAHLLAGEVTSVTMKQRELFRRLDVVGLRLAECSDALSDAMLKRSH